MKTRSLLLAVTATALVTASLAQQPTYESIRSQAAQAVGPVAVDGTTVLKGTSVLHNLGEKFQMVFDSKFRYKMSIIGALPEEDGFDGMMDWTCGQSGVPHPTYFSQKETNRLAAYFITGLWTKTDAPLQGKFVSSSATEIKLDLKCTGGMVEATVTLDAKTYLPKSLSYWGTTGADVWTFDKYQKLNGQYLPTAFVMAGGDQNAKFTVSTANTTPASDTSFKIPAVDPALSSFDNSKPDRVEMKRVLGHLFVRPLLDGKDEGWFFFDTGADVMVIDPKIARKHGRSSIGKDSTAGVVGHVETGFCNGIKFELGRLTLKAPTYIELDLDGIAKAFGFPIVGICGYDFISRAQIDIDPAKKTMGISEAKGFLSPMVWTPIAFNSNVPSLTCTYEGNRSGTFNLDTGSDSFVDFFTPTVNKFHLLRDRDLQAYQTGGAGGATESHRAKMDWFELAGKRFEKPLVGLQSTTVGVFASPYVDGNIGMGLMKNFHMILDYPHNRIALIPTG